MYVDFTKFDYKNLGMSNYAELEQRDKEFYKKVLLDWFNNQLDDMVNRKWDIEDIGFIAETSDFIKLIKEAEFSYSMEAYNSAIALIGISAEDLCRYFSNISSQSLDDLTQYNRVNKLHNDGLISKDVCDEFHIIRKIRNDCLHYNQNFKAKDKLELKKDAITVINLLKKIYATLFFEETNNDFVTYNKVLEQLSKELVENINLGDTANQDELTLKLRNSFASFTGIDLSINQSYLVLDSIYNIQEIDLEVIPNEMTLWDKRRNLLFIVDLTDSDISKIKNEQIIEGMNIVATVISKANELEMTAEWKFQNWRLVS